MKQHLLTTSSLVVVLINVFLFQFVSHPNCQQRIDRCWYEGLSKIGRADWARRFGLLFVSILVYPFLVACFLFAPKSTVSFSCCVFSVCITSQASLSCVCRLRHSDDSVCVLTHHKEPMKIIKILVVEIEEDIFA